MNHTYIPPNLDLVGSTLTIEDRYNLITAMLADYSCVVDFKKINGDIRSMPCTQREDLMPVSSVVVADEILDNGRQKNFETITVWCTDKSAWRAMKTANVTAVKVANVQWTVTTVEDEVTGDIMLPLPEDFLSIQGWKEGDELEFIDNKDGSFTIEKKM